MSGVSRAPARLSSAVSAVAAVAALGVSGFYSWPALAVGTAGLGLFVVGLARGANRAVTTGAFALFGSAVVAGARGAPAVAVLAGVTCSVLAWDVGANALSIGRQLGREADTRRVEAVHLSASGAVGAATAGAGYGLYRVGTGGQPVVALVCLLVAAVLLVRALD